MVQDPDMLSIFTGIILSDREDINRANTMFTLSGLACDDQNAQILIEHPDLLHTVLQAAALDFVAEMREVAARAVQNIYIHDSEWPEELITDRRDVLVRLSKEYTLLNIEMATSFGHC